LEIACEQAQIKHKYETFEWQIRKFFIFIENIIEKCDIFRL